MNTFRRHEEETFPIKVTLDGIRLSMLQAMTHHSDEFKRMAEEAIVKTLQPECVMELIRKEVTAQLSVWAGNMVRKAIQEAVTDVVHPYVTKLAHDEAERIIALIEAKKK